jgi:TPP-dependent 2-oxoacid decarboxylase
MITVKNKKPYTIASYLLARLNELGVEHLFGVPGDYTLDFLDEVLISPIKWTGTCNELNAGYAADGYARMKGIGAVSVTYGVGALSLLNASAGAYAEHIPLLIISGAPSTQRRASGALVHHLIADYDTQLEIFKKVTIDSAILNDPLSAADLIDRVLQKILINKLPGYLELPCDMVNVQCRKPGKLSFEKIYQSNSDSLEECIEESADLMNKAQHPVVLVGAELARFGLGERALKFIEVLELPFASMLSSKSVLPELHPQFIGIYQGVWSSEEVRNQVEASDCVLSLGMEITDLDTGLFSLKITPKKHIAAVGGRVSISNHFYHDVILEDFINGLEKKVKARNYLDSRPAKLNIIKPSYTPDNLNKLTAERFYSRLNLFLNDDMVLLSEPGDAFCAAPEFNIEESKNFIVQCYYASIGYCTPAALGVSLAEPGKRSVTLTGDGAFQMTAQEVSSLIRLKCPAIIFLINNDGYLIERMLHEDGLYNDLQQWNYSTLPAALGGGDFVIGMKVSTEGELEEALKVATEKKDKLIFIEVIVGKLDCSAGLMRLGKTFREMSSKTPK